MPGNQSSSRSHGSKRKLKLEYKKFIRMHESMLSLLRGLLPSDILAEIFMRATYSDLGVYSTTPWALSQVCAEWRTVALDNPLLWNHINIQLDEEHKTHAFLQFLSMRLTRSRQILLDLTVTVPFMRLQSVNDNFQHSAIQLLVEHAERWRVIRLHMSSTMFQVFKAIKGRLHCLELLQLSFHRFSPNDTIDIFGAAPRLRTLIINGMARVPIEFTLNIPWSQITTYQGRLDNAISSDILSKQSVALKHLRLVLGLGSEFPSSEFPPIRMENIISFSLEFPATLGLFPLILPEHFLSGVNLPSVEDIKLTNYVGRVDLVLKSLITRSHASLKKLAFSPGLGQLAPGDLTSILKLTPQLTDLVTTLPNADIYDLVINNTHPIIVPMLEHLVLHVACRHIKDEFGDRMSELVSSRCEGSNEKQSDSDDAGPNTQIPPRCLLSIRLVFYDLFQCFSTQELLDKVYRANIGSQQSEVKIVNFHPFTRDKTLSTV